MLNSLFQDVYGMAEQVEKVLDAKLKNLPAEVSRELLNFGDGSMVVVGGG